MDVDFSAGELWEQLNSVDWREPGFELNKALACVLFSKLTYLRIPAFELDGADRVNIIPCLAYQDAVLSGYKINFDEYLRSLDFGEYFVVERRYAVVVGVRTGDVIVVAIRGTKYLYDWLTNLNARRYRQDGPYGRIHFHRGFYRAMSACFEPVSLELRKFIQNSSKPVPIYVTGHSLGGAMAAIMHAVWGMSVSGEYLSDGLVENRVRSYSCYTFGMPRYGDVRSVETFRTPYHLYDELDIVPTVPPRWLGYENPTTEYLLNGNPLENVHRRETLKFSRWITRLISGKGVENHKIENYHDKIRSQVR